MIVHSIHTSIHSHLSSCVNPLLVVENLPDYMEAWVEGSLLPEPANEGPGSLGLCGVQLWELVL